MQSTVMLHSFEIQEIENDVNLELRGLEKNCLGKCGASYEWILRGKHR